MKRAFTLIELMVVISVIAILATIALFGFGTAQASARDVSRAQVMNGLRTALERYYGDNQSYYTTNNNFCGLVAALVAAGYLTTTPNDPRTKAAICGAGNPTVGGATYTYVGAAQSYTLTLAKESGGSQTFINPQ